MKNKLAKISEYESKYYQIPRDYKDRLLWLYETLKIDDTLSDEIIDARNRFMNSVKFNGISFTIYEVPEHTPRPRATLVRKKDIINAAYGGDGFIHVYSPLAGENNAYMQFHMREAGLSLEQLLCTPCDVEYRLYFPTPKGYNKKEIFLAEIGLDRPIAKPDVDNSAKSYMDAFTGNIWLDDILVVDTTIRKYYSVLPRVEVDLIYSNYLYNKHQYKSMINRKDFDEKMTVDYFQ